ncbi:MAG: anti-sigma factor antagonist [Clostridia bacterium]|nr:anti-sigma factor antagonist [Clostridia bacterium]
MQLITNCQNKTVYITLRGELDEHTASRARKDADKLVEQYASCESAVFDLREMSFMDSTGIGFLIGRYKAFSRYGVVCYIGGVTPATDRILSMSGIYALMPKL